MTAEHENLTVSSSSEEQMWELLLFIAGDSDATRRASAHLEKICQEHLAGRCRIEVVDILEQPDQADLFDIIATPTLVRRRPQPIRKIIGDLSITDRVLAGLGLSAQTYSY